MIIDPKEYFKIDYKKVLKEKGIKGIPIVMGYFLLKTGEILSDVIHLIEIISYSNKEEGKKDKEKGGE
jgi:hypothetical protein